MPPRAYSLTLLAIIPVAFFGCGDPQGAATEAAGRPQRIISAQVRNPFVGDWGPIEGYVANDWIARFTPDGRMSVKGPGLVARGTYVAAQRIAEANYTARDGTTPTGDLGHGTFSISSDGRELTFTTGIPNDPPVRLRKRP